MGTTDFHMSFRETVSLTLLAAALEKSYPHFHRAGAAGAVNAGGKEYAEKVFRTLKEFSTSFPQTPVDAETRSA